MANPLVSAISSAIATMEGAKPYNNNPGNIMDLPYYKETGNFRVAQYSSPEAGQSALESLVSKYIDGGLNLQQFFEKYAPLGHGNNNPTAYANFVSSQVGVDTQTPLNQLSSGVNNAVANIQSDFSSSGDQIDYVPSTSEESSNGESVSSFSDSPSMVEESLNPDLYSPSSNNYVEYSLVGLAVLIGIVLISRR